MGISSNSLFHFTKNLDVLKLILLQGFKPSFYFEDMEYAIGVDYLQMGIPMVCFCDIPLTSLKDHVSKYGYYGIGLTKKWGQKHHLNPIAYIVPESSFTRLIRKIGLIINNSVQTSKTERLQAIFDFVNLAYYTKIIGNPVGSTEFDSEYYNEKEWRYIPKLEIENLSRDVDCFPFIEIMSYEEEKDTSEFQMKYESFVRDNMLKFDLKNDVKYIIVANNHEKELIGEFLENNFSEDYINFISKLRSIQEIDEDY